MIECWTVRFDTAPRTASPPMSGPQVMSTWSRTMFEIGPAAAWIVRPSVSAGSVVVASPVRNRMCRITTSWVRTLTISPRTTTPSPGAVWPATVRYGLSILMDDARVITPATWKTTVRGPVPSSAARSEPGPASASVVTR
jgi:hypothetical protein